MTNKKCSNCAWFCHADGKCYVPSSAEAFEPPYRLLQAFECNAWTFDGLEDWEREDQPALMTMDEVGA